MAQSPEIGPDEPTSQHSPIVRVIEERSRAEGVPAAKHLLVHGTPALWWAETIEAQRNPSRLVQHGDETMGLLTQRAGVALARYGV